MPRALIALGFALACGCGRAEAPSPAAGAAPLTSAVEKLLAPVEAPAPGTHQPAPDAPLIASDQRVGVFPVPQGATFVRNVGPTTQYRMLTTRDKLARFYRQFHLAVFEGPSGLLVRPGTGQDRDQLLAVTNPHGAVFLLTFTDHQARR